MQAKYGNARAVELDGEVALVVEASDGFRLRVLLPAAAAFRLSNDLDEHAERIVAERDGGKQCRRERQPHGDRA